MGTLRYESIFYRNNVISIRTFIYKYNIMQELRTLIYFKYLLKNGNSKGISSYREFKDITLHIYSVYNE